MDIFRDGIFMFLFNCESSSLEVKCNYHVLDGHLTHSLPHAVGV